MQFNLTVQDLMRQASGVGIFTPNQTENETGIDMVYRVSVSPQIRGTFLGIKVQAACLTRFGSRTVQMLRSRQGKKRPRSRKGTGKADPSWVQWSLNALELATGWVSYTLES